MNKQEVFDKVSKHLLTQKERAVIYKNGVRFFKCVYKAPNGFKCAIGCLIPDELYDPEIENEDVHNMTGLLNTVMKTALGDIDYDDRQFLGSLQWIHDRVDPDYWSIYLDKFAIEHKLENNSKC